MTLRTPVCRMPLPLGGFDHSAVEGASLVEDRDEVAEVGLAGRRIEAAVLAGQALESVDELQAPSRVGLSGHATAGDVDVHRRGVGQHRLVERVGVAGAAGHGRDPSRPVLQRRLEAEFGCRVAVCHDPIGSDEREVLGLRALNAGADVEAVPATISRTAPGPRPFTSKASHGPLVTTVRPSRMASLNASTDRPRSPRCA
jgi:hypothetical protein